MKEAIEFLKENKKVAFVVFCLNFAGCGQCHPRLSGIFAASDKVDSALQ